MEKEKSKSQIIWFVVDKHNKVWMYLDEPKKNQELGCWQSKYPYVNSFIYDEICQVANNALLNFDSEAQCLELQIK